MKRKHRVWYSLLRLDEKDWYKSGKWYEDPESPCSNNARFNTLKQVNKHLNKKDNIDAEFHLTKWYIKHGERWVRDFEIYHEGSKNEK